MLASGSGSGAPTLEQVKRWWRSETTDPAKRAANLVCVCVWRVCV